MKGKKKMALYITLAILILAVVSVLVILPPSKGKIPAFWDENGEIVANSIAEKTWVDIDGAKIGMILLGKNQNNPVLLVCGGGPGIPEYLLENLMPSALTEHFVVAYFDYRGTGLSYDKVNPDEITSERYLADVDALTDYLSSRFNREKIYIMGHSFGSYIALNASKNHPEKYEAYLAVSQAVKQKESEYLAYDYMLEEYKNQGNSSMVSKLEKVPIKTSEESYKEYFSSGLRDKAMHGLGVGTTRDMKSVISGIFFPSLKMKAYTPSERINIWKGKKAANKFAVHNDSQNYDAFEKVKELDIPIYFFAGKYDYTCAEPLQKKYFEAIQAPEKEYFLYENSAHSPVFEEYDTTDKNLRKILNKE